MESPRESGAIIEKVPEAAAKRLLFLTHAVQQPVRIE
jgi:hypothetical protein